MMSHMKVNMAAVNKMHAIGLNLEVISLTLILFSFEPMSGLSRTLHSQYNPGCPSNICNYHNGSHINLLHTTAAAKKDEMHYVVSSIGTPSMLVARTEPNTKMYINWDDLVSKNTSVTTKSIKFVPRPHYVYAVLISKLILYNDTDDKANVSLASPNATLNYNFADFLWQNSDYAGTVNETENYINFTATAYKGPQELDFMKNGSISMKFQIFGQKGRNSQLPHLDQTANSTQFDLTIYNWNTTYTQPRFALQFTMLAQTVKHTEMNISSYSNIDDEQTPGVFQVVDWTSEGKNQTVGAYLQWKPVCYTSTPRDMQSATKASSYQLKKRNMTTEELESIVYAYYGLEMTGSNVTARTTNISFGLPHDKFYTNTYYTSWSVMIGYGSPPQGHVSLTIILVIAIGLGLPAVIIIFGGIAVCIKRRRDRTRGYTSITSNSINS